MQPRHVVDRLPFRVMSPAAGVRSPPTPKRARPFAVAVGVTLVFMALSVERRPRLAQPAPGRGPGRLRRPRRRGRAVGPVGPAEHPGPARGHPGQRRTTSTRSTPRPSRTPSPAPCPSGWPRWPPSTLVESGAPRTSCGSSPRTVGPPAFPTSRCTNREPGGSPPAIATFEASNRGGAAILSGYDLRSVPALAEALRPERRAGCVRITPVLDPLPAEVLAGPSRPRSLGLRPGRPRRTRAPGSWPSCPATSWPPRPPASTTELDVALDRRRRPARCRPPVRAAPSVDLDAVDPEARTRPRRGHRGRARSSSPSPTSTAWPAAAGGSRACCSAPASP